MADFAKAEPAAATLSSLLAGSSWSALPPPATVTEAAKAARLAVAMLLNATWPENGTVKNRYGRLQRSSSALVFACLPSHDGDAAALGTVSLREVNANDGPELARVAAACPSACVLYSLVVAAPVQGRGLGRHLLQRAEAEAVGHGFSHVFLSAEAHVRPFYEKLGYEVVSQPGWKQRTRNPQSWLRKALAAEAQAGTGGADACAHATSRLEQLVVAGASKATSTPALAAGCAPW